MLSVLALASFLHQPILTDAFSPSANRIVVPKFIRSETALFGSKRRGRLANNVSLNDEGKVSKVLTNKEKQKLGNSKTKRSVSSKKSKSENNGVAISPLLAEWATSSTDTDDVASTTSTSSASSPAATVFVPFADEDDELEIFATKKKNRKKSEKEAKRSAREEENAMQSAQIEAILGSIEDLLETTNCDVSQLVSYIKNLVDVGNSSNNQVLTPNLKSLVSARPSSRKGAIKSFSGEAEEDSWKQPSFRLAWVGSDDAICHIGTSLHKVPLARLQEIYLLLGYNRWELLEVIRILGPFPNVRNTLRGDIKLEKKRAGDKREGVRLTISYNSMVDGTGKEILAGKEDNVKYVKLDVWFASEKAIVCTVPAQDVEGTEVDDADPFANENGESILLFVAEENLDEQLEKLRAA